MLVLTPTAVAVVNNLTTAVGPESAGLRISSDTGAPEPGLQAQITTEPATNDQLLAEAGARVFLDSDAASFLDDKVLDAKVDDEGQAHFTLGPQGQDDSETPQA